MRSLFSRKVRKTRLHRQFVNDDCVPQLPDATEKLDSKVGDCRLIPKLFANIKFRAKLKTAFQRSRTGLDGATMSELFMT
jgi:hypothetical protein